MLQLVGVISGSATLVRVGTLGWAPLILLVLPSILVGVLWHRAGKNGGLVPGAVDNLSASALTVAMGAFLSQNPTYIPEDTEIRFISFGSEEAGLRGSRRYVKRHLDELKRLDARLLNYEMVAYPEIAITTSDRNGTLKNDPEMVKSVFAAAQRAGVPHRVQPASFGTCTDAAPFTQAGLKALTLVPFRFPQQLVGFYHQRTDTPDKVSIEPLENVLKLTLEWIRCGGE
ncbi:MAG TPA: M28 family peptidase [Anaerolineaceae bacterium]|nr:M28 family peptidase [Anaerolineaceae bacterium]